jgi:DNA-binding transcriptional regulator YdaS (Cro superfamily)
MEAIAKAVKEAGGQQALAQLCGVRYQAVQKWLRTGRVPAKRVLQIERVTGVSRHDLCPDLYPRELRRSETRTAA